MLLTASGSTSSKLASQLHGHLIKRLHTLAPDLDKGSDWPGADDHCSTTGCHTISFTTTDLPDASFLFDHCPNHLHRLVSTTSASPTA